MSSKYFSSLICANAFLAIRRLKCSKASLANIFQSESVTLRQAILYALLENKTINNFHVKQ
jgi:hypothetical protein